MTNLPPPMGSPDDPNGQTPGSAAPQSDPTAPIAGAEVSPPPPPPGAIVPPPGMPPPPGAVPPPMQFGPPMPQAGSSSNTGVIISVFIGAMVVVLGLAAFLVLNLSGGEDDTAPGTESDNAADWDPDAPVDGVTDYYAEQAPWVEETSHLDGKIDYPMAPPAGGSHNVAWSTCNGVVYDQRIPSEHAVHSLEHGAVWFTYSPDLPQTEIDKLVTKVNAVDYTFMSPFPGQDAPIILSAWGYQLKVDSADDERITAFTAKYRVTASREPGATCNGGTPITGDTPMSSAP
ncbi:uncharacterized protein DUF3105 [Stackebrandtia endophytica]|uniref:Uncharacterized protein DUF3105 n=1 Tax=Stackebrandtia endophytica TaxID=1496996 RepID=A0A543B0Y6_9ACTN|nr:DUF3105 domain-containing protein [Stackebrandtia endophytica]TQL78479.1 uncharacterized protein DUF3105 [Stackebrandtia endophytica]